MRADWTQICKGRYTCFLGNCQQTCDSNGTCNAALGETADSCLQDRLGGDYDCEVSTDCDGLSLPSGCQSWRCVNRNCNPVCL